MKKLILSTIFAFSALMAGGNIAVAPVAPVVVDEDPDMYVGIFGSYGIGDYSGDVICIDRDKNTRCHLKPQHYSIDDRYDVGVAAGWEFYKNNGFYTAVEGRLSYEWGSDDWQNTREAIYLKPGYDFDNGFGVYGLLGWAWNQYEYNVPCYVNRKKVKDKKFRNHNNTFVYGAGVKYKINKSVEVYVDYTRDKEKMEVQGGSFTNDRVILGINYRF
jgi:opacity protein-like surface antigen